MRRITAIGMIFTILLVVTGCANSKTINGQTYEPYGLLNADDLKDPCIRYEPVWGNIIWGVILIESIIAPIYFFGFSVFEPVGEKRGACTPLVH